MASVLARPRTAIQGLLDAALKFRDRIRGAAASHELPKARLQALDDICGEIPTRVAALSQSVMLIEKTSLDIVDMETRMQNETRKLTDLLGALGDSVHGQFFLQRHFENELVGREEAAQELAAGLFPGAVQGLNMVNSKLWEFTNLQMIIYKNTLKSIKGHMFGEVLQNHLTGQKTDAFKVRRILDEQRVAPIGGFHIASPA